LQEAYTKMYARSQRTSLGTSIHPFALAFSGSGVIVKAFTLDDASRSVMGESVAHGCHTSL
jgi:hypothetical protein